jgi:hypothetical protein
VQRKNATRHTQRLHVTAAFGRAGARLGSEVLV